MKNENIDLTKILKDCPKGEKFYSSIYGEVEFDRIGEYDSFPIVFIVNQKNGSVTADGKHFENYDGECTFFPSKEQRDWSKFTAPWYKKKEKFDPKTLNPFDKVLCRNGLDIWRCDFFSSYNGNRVCPNVCIGDSYLCCIPYNDETKYLVGTTEKAPEYYRLLRED